jgi:Cys-tRNA(Pro)/Cys-tRNA(Cys) deacylase
MAYHRIINMLNSSGVEFRVHAHEPIRIIEEARKKAPRLSLNLLKTIVFRIKDSHWILAAVNGTNRIDYRKLADAFGVKRRAVRSVSSDHVKKALGFEVGGVGPFPVREDVKIVFDDRLAGLGKIFCGSGKNTLTIEIEIADLISLTCGIVFPICRRR